MRASQLRGALLCARRRLSVAASACALGLLLSACGGSDSISTPSSAELPVTVIGADGASVSLRPLQRETAQQVTVRVARDGTGAPLLGEGYTPLGAVYQFTPLGWVEEAVEIRVPFVDSDNGEAPHLLIAQPGGDWMEVANARREGNFMVARVPQLAYATVAASTTSTSATERVRALGARIMGTSSTSPLALSFDAQTTTPALPAADTKGIVTVTNNTSLGLTLQYALPSGCSVAPVVSAYAAVWQEATQKLKTVQLGSRSVPSTAGSVAYTVPLSASDNGTWVFASLAYCKEPGRLLPRYAVVSAGPGLVVNIGSSTPTPPPAITSAPLDVSVVEGTSASFSVAATGDALAYEWQRSNDGGATFAPVGAANAPSFSLVASLSDNNALFRVKVSNANGSTTSTPAKLTVTQKVIAPTVTSDPANQTVIEGETASFSVAGSGQPAPTVQWQQRAAANADAEAGWADIAGATGTTYTTPATALAQSGAQYRALLRNAGGTATTLAASLTVNARVVAPAIVTAPQSLSVAAGQFGALAVTASGTSPLSYQWFKNGQAIAGANASEILVFADPVDAGGSYQITVQVSNAAGAVTSAPATLSVAATPPPAGGTLIKAGEAGVVQAGADASLVVPAGALASDTVIAIGQEAQAAVTLPVDFTAMSDAYDITPAGLVFASPVMLNLPAPDTLPEGTVLAFVELSSTSAPLSVNRAALAPVNVRKLALGKAASSRRTIAAAGSVINVLCTTPQNSRSGSVTTSLFRAARFVTAAVPESACQDTAPPPSRALIPSTSTDPCKTNDFASVGAGTQAALVSRHVSCVQSGTTALSFTELASIAPNGQQRSYGAYTFEWRVGSDGPAKDLNKTYRLSFRLTQTEAGEITAPLKLDLRPAFQCGSTSGDATATCSHGRPTPLSITAGSGWSQPISVLVNFTWSAGDNTWAEFTPQIQLLYAQPGQDVNVEKDPVTGDSLSYFYLSGTTPPIRCDKGMSVNGGSGCVYANAPAVLVLSATDARVKEAAEHIRDAQKPVAEGGIGALGGLDIASDGSATASFGKALQRTRIVAAQDTNRWMACAKNNPSSFRLTRPAPRTSTCPADETPCQCDEYPFASTWNGGISDPSGAAVSVRIVQGAQNGEAGSRLGRFYQSERVLDYTMYSGPATTPTNPVYDPASESNRGGDNFWVHIE